MSALSQDLPQPRVERLEADVEALTRMTRPDVPYTRRAFSDEDRAARAWIAGEMRQAGLAVTVDAAANVIGRLPGRQDGPSIMTGSHLDTVQAGGRFDGIAGVLAALEVARVLHETGHRLARPLEVVNFTCEEPSDFGLSTIGSRAMSGRIGADTVAALRDRGGRSLGDAIDTVGGRAGRLEEARRAPGTIARYVELHIEQSASLDRAGLPLGVVTAIAAPTRFRVTIRGRQDHAGGTPMAVRKDALAPAAELVLLVERLAREAGRGMVGTVGALTVHPNMVNIVPGEVELLADFRGIHPAAIGETLARFEDGVVEVARARGVTIDVAGIVREEPLHVDADMIQHAAAAAESVRVPFARLTSGASHDANHIARLCPIGMLFIACRYGRSHCPEEWAEPAHLAAGTRVLLELVLRLDAALAEPSPTP
ncbi:MAG TPA: M20 family metallo-hydrolase [Methylomirabilota bacterium]|jgi:N-carbamoyl-L-amino-acid hydrolase|nr:M20 family metallo-hydrolase [Methylomirabilota bacterium]